MCGHWLRLPWVSFPAPCLGVTGGGRTVQVMAEAGAVNKYVLRLGANVEFGSIHKLPLGKVFILERSDCETVSIFMLHSKKERMMCLTSDFAVLPLS